MEKATALSGFGLLSEPTPLSDSHSLEDFDCGATELDNWLRQHALANQKTNSTRTFVVCDEKGVAGFYSLTSGSVTRIEMPRKLRQGIPDPVPVIILARLARDGRYKGTKLGLDLLKDALSRALVASETIGCRGILVHAKPGKEPFYQDFGFIPFPNHPQTFFMPIEKLRLAIS